MGVLLAVIYGLAAEAYDSVAGGVAAVVFSLVLLAAATIYVIYLIGKRVSRP
jgi:hypothetical protein